MIARPVHTASLPCAAAVLLAGLALLGCHAKEVAAPGKAAASNGSTSTPGNTESARAALEHASTGGVRTDAGKGIVDMRFALGKAPQPGEPFTVVVSVIPIEGAPALKLEVPPVAGLELKPVSAPLSYDKVEPGAIYTVPLDFIAATPGVHVVTVVATEPSPSGADSATYAFPVVVGINDLAPAAPPVAASGTPAAASAPAAAAPSPPTG